MTDRQSIVIIGGGHNGLVCGAYLAKAGHQVQIIEARNTLGGGATTHSFAEGFKVSGLAHLLYPLNPKISSDLDLVAAGLETGTPVDTITLDQAGRHLTLGANSASGLDLSQADADAYRRFKTNFRDYATALEPLMMNKPPRLKDMDRGDKVTLAKLGWKLRFGLGADGMKDFLRVGGINIHDVLSEEFTDPRLRGALAADAVLGHHMGPRTPGTVLTYLHRMRSESNGNQCLPPGGMGQVANALAESARRAGVKVRTGTRVEKILVEDGRAVLGHGVVAAPIDVAAHRRRLVADGKQRHDHVKAQNRVPGNGERGHLLRIKVRFGKMGAHLVHQLLAGD
jgi:phytoene dehydrogenase-like protein